MKSAGRRFGSDVSVLLTAAGGPDATKLFSDLGALAIPFEAHATIGEIHYLVAGDGNQISVVEAWAFTPAGLDDPPRRADGVVEGGEKRGHFWRRLALLLEAFRKEPFPLVRRRFSERTGAVTGAPVLGAATRNP